MVDLQSFFLKKYQELKIPIPSVHFVLGSFFGKAFEELKKQKTSFSSWENRGRISFNQVPDFISPSAPTHSGYYEYFFHKEKNVSLCVQSGRLHGYEGLRPEQVVRTVVGPCEAGTSCFVLSNISGSLKKELPVGTVVAVQDHINFTGQSPICGLVSRSKKEQKKLPYFLNMEGAYDTKLTSAILEKLQQKNQKVCSGVYLGVLGPQYETPAEIRFFAKTGADVVGMSTLWEVMALHYLKARMGVFSLVSNLACGIGKSVSPDYSLIRPPLTAIIESVFDFSADQM